MCEPIAYLSFATQAFHQSQLSFSSWFVFVMSLQGSLLLSMFVFDILQIPSGHRQIFSGCSAPTCIPPLAMCLTTGLWKLMLICR